MNGKVATLLVSLSLIAVGCTSGPPPPTPTPTTPPPLATAQAVVAAARSGTTVAPTPATVPTVERHGRSQEDPAPGAAGVTSEEGYVIFAKITDDDASQKVSSANPAGPTPAAGKRYVGVTVIMSSGQQASKSVKVSTSDFLLIGASGTEFKPLTNLGVKGPEGEMTGGHQLFGELVFELPKNEVAKLLRYEATGNSGAKYFLSLAEGQ